MLKKANLLRIPVDVEIEGIDKHEFVPLAAPSIVVVEDAGWSLEAKKGSEEADSPKKDPTAPDGPVMVDPMDVGFGSGV